MLQVGEAKEQGVEGVKDAGDGAEAEGSTGVAKTLEAVVAVEETCAAPAELVVLEGRIGELEEKLASAEGRNSELEREVAVALETAREMEGKLSASRRDMQERERELEAVKLSGSGLEADLAKAEEVGAFLRTRVVELEKEVRGRTHGP